MDTSLADRWNVEHFSDYRKSFGTNIPWVIMDYVDTSLADRRNVEHFSDYRKSFGTNIPWVILC